MGWAPRDPFRLLKGLARGAALMLCAGLAVPGPARADPGTVLLGARYGEPTTRYAHGVLGDAVEWGSLQLSVDFCAGCARPDIRNVTIRLPETRVFEDLAPRLIDLDGHGPSAVIVVESDVDRGARLAIYSQGGLVAATPFIGRANRWLAPVGAADLDGDGSLEIAYIDRPHLAKVLRVWRLRGENLEEVGALEGFSNHQIGWDHIPGGLRDCGTGVEIIVASGDWQRIAAIRFVDGFVIRDLGEFSLHRMASVMECR